METPRVFYNSNYFVPFTSVKYCSEESTGLFILLLGSSSFVNVTEPIKLLNLKKPTVYYVLGNTICDYFIRGWVNSFVKESPARFATIPLNNILMIKQIGNEYCEVELKEDRGCIYITGLLTDLVSSLVEI
jgi:hypothetical protein